MLNINAKTVKLLEGNIGESLPDGDRQSFLRQQEAIITNCFKFLKTLDFI